MNKEFVVGIDLGGTKISGALSDLEGNIVKKYTIPTNAHEGEIKVLNRLIAVIEHLLKAIDLNESKIKSIGIGSPGPLDTKKGIIITTPNLPFKNFNIVQPVLEKFNIPTYIDNDANVATIGEHVFGAGKGKENILFVTVSTGIGGGAIINGKVYRGNTSNALEIGHMTLKKDGPRCNCGNIGCAEALASGTAIGKAGVKAVYEGKDTSLSNYEKVTSYEVFKEAEKGDKVSKEIIDEALNYLGICIANLITTFDPEMVIIGGGVSKAGDIIFDKVKDVVRKRCFSTLYENTEIVKAGLGTDAGVIGALALAITESR